MFPLKQHNRRWREKKLVTITYNSGKASDNGLKGTMVNSVYDAVMSRDDGVTFVTGALDATFEWHILMQTLAGQPQMHSRERVLLSAGRRRVEIIKIMSLEETLDSSRGFQSPPSETPLSFIVLQLLARLLRRSAAPAVCFMHIRWHLSHRKDCI